ncbi:hypothetical protein Aduo_007017 [Ancylostoma duodenale]
MLAVSLLLILQSLVFAQSPDPKPVTKPLIGSLLDFGRMGRCILGYSPIIYNNYGCWCGVGGSHEPVDEIDKCCMHHDKCYDAAVDAGICQDVGWQYISGYNWECVNGTAVCAEKQGACEAALCACDSAAVQCWAKQPRPQKKMRCNYRHRLILPYGFQH